MFQIFFDLQGLPHRYNRGKVIIFSASLEHCRTPATKYVLIMNDLGVHRRILVEWQPIKHCTIDSEQSLMGDRSSHIFDVISHPNQCRAIILRSATFSLYRLYKPAYKISVQSDCRIGVVQNSAYQFWSLIGISNARQFTLRIHVGQWKAGIMIFQTYAGSTTPRQTLTTQSDDEARLPPTSIASLWIPVHDPVANHVCLMLFPVLRSRSRRKPQRNIWPFTSLEYKGPQEHLTKIEATIFMCQQRVLIGSPMYFTETGWKSF